MMKKARGLRIGWSVAALVVLLMTATPVWAQPAPGRADERRRVELKIAKLEERLELSPVSGEGGWRESQLVLAASQLKLARKLLGRSNVRAAEVVASQAERALARVEEKEARQ